jgi:hypothetical protein
LAKILTPSNPTSNVSKKWDSAAPNQTFFFFFEKSPKAHADSIFWQAPNWKSVWGGSPLLLHYKIEGEEMGAKHYPQSQYLSSK